MRIKGLMKDIRIGKVNVLGIVKSQPSRLGIFLAPANVQHGLWVPCFCLLDCCRSGAWKAWWVLATWR